MCEKQNSHCGQMAHFFQCLIRCLDDWPSLCKLSIFLKIFWVLKGYCFKRLMGSSLWKNVSLNTNSFTSLFGKILVFLVLWSHFKTSKNLQGANSSLENKTVLCRNFWILRFFWKIGLDNFKILLKNFLIVKNKLWTGHVVKMLCPKMDIKEHGKLWYIQTKAS